ncbi:MAG: helix-turn-helix domain-containing protein [Clostridiales bacterium]|nr:helix-turn-helix domain-containing protein [Clostridiales bacterium]
MFGDTYGEKFGENATQDSIVEIMRQTPTISAKAIGQRLGLTTRGVEKAIKSLKASGIVARVGSAKGGNWVVVK